MIKRKNRNRLILIGLVIFLVVVLVMLHVEINDIKEIKTKKFDQKNGGSGGYDGDFLWVSVPNKNGVGQITYTTDTYAFGVYGWIGKFESNATEGWITQGLTDMEAKKYIAFERIYSEDIFRCITYDKIISNSQMNNTEATILDFDDFDGWHIYKIEWRSRYVNFFIDGELVANHTNSVPHIKLHFHTIAYVNAWMDKPGDTLKSILTDIRLRQEVLIGET